MSYPLSPTYSPDEPVEELSEEESESEVARMFRESDDEHDAPSYSASSDTLRKICGLEAIPVLSWGEEVDLDYPQTAPRAICLSKSIPVKFHYQHEHYSYLFSNELSGNTTSKGMQIDVPVRSFAGQRKTRFTDASGGASSGSTSYRTQTTVNVRNVQQNFTINAPNSVASQPTSSIIRAAVLPSPVICTGAGVSPALEEAAARVCHQVTLNQHLSQQAGSDVDSGRNQSVERADTAMVDTTSEVAMAEAAKRSVQPPSDASSAAGGENDQALCRELVQRFGDCTMHSMPTAASTVIRESSASKWLKRVLCTNLMAAVKPAEIMQRELGIKQRKSAKRAAVHRSQRGA